MSMFGRRYDTERINDIRYNSHKRYQENKKYRVIEYNENFVNLYVYDHTDYVILSTLNALRNRYIDKNQCTKILDKIEGYYFAFEEGLISANQLCQKLNQEIMREELHQENWNHLGVFKNDVYKR